MTTLDLDVHGVRVAVTGDPEAVSGLRTHFEAFVAAPAPAAIRVELVRERRAPPLPIATRADQIVERGLVYNEGARTLVDHHGHATSEYDFARERGTVAAPALEDAVELGYLMVSSRIGELLERRGLVRVHAVGVAREGRAAIVLAPSGGGKSTLARAFLRDSRASLVGDDLVLLDRRGQVLPFPTPIGLTDPRQAEGLGRAIPFPRRHHAPKWMLPYADVAERFARGPLRLDLVVVLARLSSGPARLVPSARAEVVPSLFRDAVVGLGLPQVLELVARRGARDLPRLAPTAIARAWSAASAIASARAAILEAGRAEDAARAVVDALGDEGSR